MTFYHGTTLRSAIRIAEMGFLPRKGVVWFTTSKNRAQRRAKQKTRKTASSPFVFVCEIDVQELSNRLGKNFVMHSKGFLAIRGRVLPTVILNSSELIARWVSQILQGESYQNISPHHPGIDRLSRWVENRMNASTDSPIRPKEFSQRLRQWLPNFFRGVKISPEDLRFDYSPELVEFETESSLEPVDSREENALEALADAKPKRRIRGLELLAQLEHEDLYEWCTVLISDESVEVRIAALQTIAHCDDGDPEVLLPLAESQNKRIRGSSDCRACQTFRRRRAPLV